MAGIARLAGTKKLPQSGRGAVAFGVKGDNKPQPIQDPQLRSAVEQVGGFVNPQGYAVVPTNDDQYFSEAAQRLMAAGYSGDATIAALNPVSKRQQAAGLVPQNVISNDAGNYGTYASQEKYSITDGQNVFEISPADLQLAYQQGSSGMMGKYFEDDRISGRIKPQGRNLPNVVEVGRKQVDGTLTHYDPMLDPNYQGTPEEARAEHIKMFGDDAPITGSVSNAMNVFNQSVHSPGGYGIYSNQPLGGLQGKRADFYRNVGFADNPNDAWAFEQYLDTRRFNTPEAGMVLAAGDQLFNPEIAPLLRQSRQQIIDMPPRWARRVERQSGVNPQAGMQQLPDVQYEYVPDDYLDRMNRLDLFMGRTSRSNYFNNANAPLEQSLNSVPTRPAFTRAGRSYLDLLAG